MAASERSEARRYSSWDIAYCQWIRTKWWKYIETMNKCKWNPSNTYWIFINFSKVFLSGCFHVDSSHKLICGWAVAIPIRMGGCGPLAPRVPIKYRPSCQRYNAWMQNSSKSYSSIANYTILALIKYFIYVPWHLHVRVRAFYLIKWISRQTARKLRTIQIYTLVIVGRPTDIFVSSR